MEHIGTAEIFVYVHILERLTSDRTIFSCPNLSQTFLFGFFFFFFLPVKYMGGKSAV